MNHIDDTGGAVGAERPREVRDAAGLAKVGSKTPNGTIVGQFKEFAPKPPPGLSLNTRPSVPLRKTIYHKIDGAALMYAVDADAALKRFPGEWRAEPWPTSAPSA